MKRYSTNPTTRSRQSEIFSSFLPEIKTDSRECLGLNYRSEMAADSDIMVWLENKQEQTLTLYQKLLREGPYQSVINTYQDVDRMPGVYLKHFSDLE